MPKKTPSKAKEKGVLANSMEGWSLLAKEGKKGYKWAANRIKKDLQKRKRA